MSDSTKIIITAIIAAAVVIVSAIIFAKEPIQNPLANLTDEMIREICIQEEIE